MLLLIILYVLILCTQTAVFTLSSLESFITIVAVFFFAYLVITSVSGAVRW